jgi:hypothetical protein
MAVDLDLAKFATPGIDPIRPIARSISTTRVGPVTTGVERTSAGRLDKRSGIMRSVSRGFVLAAVAILALSSSVVAGEQRPMSGGFTIGVVPVEQRCGPNALTIGFSGAGWATHLGRITGTGSNCTEFSLATSAVAIWDGVATYVAADGSTITLAYEGSQEAPDAGVAQAMTVNTVISGTGRFADAEGSWTDTGVIDFTTGVYVGEISGWISY